MTGQAGYCYFPRFVLIVGYIMLTSRVDKFIVLLDIGYLYQIDSTSKLNIIHKNGLYACVVV